MDQQSFNLNAAGFGRHTEFFIKIVMAIIFVYVFILLLNFLRDRYINKDTTSKPPQIIDLLSILNKLFLISGFGFIVGDILQSLLSESTRNGGINTLMNFRNNWDYLTFGVVLIFIGIAFKVAKQTIVKEKEN